MFIPKRLVVVFSVREQLRRHSDKMAVSILKGCGASALTPVTSYGQDKDQWVEAKEATFHMNRDQHCLIIRGDQSIMGPFALKNTG